jgi:hypothetical protein
MVLKVYVCRFCKVPVVSKTDTRAIPLREHAKHCRRSKK